MHSLLINTLNQSRKEDIKKLSELVVLGAGTPITYGIDKCHIMTEGDIARAVDTIEKLQPIWTQKQTAAVAEKIKPTRGEKYDQ